MECVNPRMRTQEHWLVIEQWCVLEKKLKDYNTRIAANTLLFPK